jgi:hypothetical protein
MPVNPDKTEFLLFKKGREEGCFTALLFYIGWQYLWIAKLSELSCILSSLTYYEQRLAKHLII